MKVLKIVETVVDGPHLRTSIYFAGCPHHCTDCHNKSSWDFNQGTSYTPEELFNKIKKIGNKYITLSGGDPLCQSSEELIQFLSLVKDYNIWCYTGYTYEKLLDFAQNEESQGIGNSVLTILKGIDVLVDGPFINSLKSEDCKWRGSTNQRLIDVQESLKSHKTILYNE